MKNVGIKIAPEYSHRFQKIPHSLSGACISIPIPKIHMKKLVVKSVKPIPTISFLFFKKTNPPIIKLAIAVKKADRASGFIFEDLYF
jgi:hypothetical protein